MLGTCAVSSGATALAQPLRAVIAHDPSDPVASTKPALWATTELESALAERGIRVERLAGIPDAAPGSITILAAGKEHIPARFRDLANANLADAPESFALIPGGDTRSAVLACGTDARGLSYALTEIADRVRCSSSPLQALRLSRAESARPANEVRAISRCFQSELEDKPWYYDRAFWDAYLSMLASQRFNRFALTFGLGYDFTRNITDSYFHFAYPFLVSVPGYDVRATGLSEREREQNLEMLRYSSDAAAERGLDFQLGLWTHAFQWTDSPHANYVITGLTAANQAAYCRDALKSVLLACPNINTLAFRIHGESGVPEGSYDFWKLVFDGAVQSGRCLELNLHAKGIDQRLIDVALATGLPISVSPKYWAEHMGLPYQQASIRELEKPPRDGAEVKFFALSSGSRQFLRYSYGDLLTADRRYRVYSRMWPGTQRVLLWGDPASAAAYGRSSQFCGESGADLFEPLSFKGRRGSGVAGGRCSYADATLNPRHDWEKFLYSYRLWGRHLYSPDADPECWRRFLRWQFGAAASAIGSALANASRILPLVTTAHAPSAANNNYWPEMYTNMAIVRPAKGSRYGDTPSPKLFGKASSFDPELFSTVDEYAAELLNGQPSGKYSPVQVATWLEDLSKNADRFLAQAEAQAKSRNSPEFRCVAADVRIQSGLGKFFAAKFRVGVLYGLFMESGASAAISRAILMYQTASAAWAAFASRARDVYLADVTYGPEGNLRGHWWDRLAGIDDDIAAMKDLAAASVRSAGRYSEERVAQAVHAAVARVHTPSVQCNHAAPKNFTPGQPLALEASVTAATSRIISLRIHYRHVNQAESYSAADMDGGADRFSFAIPASYTESPFHLQYFFEWKDMAGNAGLLPGIEPDTPRQPYYVVAPQQRRF